MYRTLLRVASGSFKTAGRIIFRVVVEPWKIAAGEFLDALDAALFSGRRLAGLLFFTAGCWVLYVPLHELLHALGAIASGGSVQELQIQSLYGGRILERIFPFVRSGGKYAGRLTRFDTNGSDLVYLAIDLAPFVPTALAASTLLRIARARKSIVLLAPGTMLVVAPLLSLTGDLYEAGSVLLTALALPPAGFLVDRDRWMALRSDDLVALLGEFTARFPTHRVLFGTAVTISALLGMAVGGLILHLSALLADRWTRGTTQIARDAAS